MIFSFAMMFAFYVNKSGWRARKRFIVHWEGHPKSFALHYPYVLAFEPTFIEVRDVESGRLMQIIQGNNLRCIFAEAPPSTTHGASMFYNAAYRAAYGNDPRQSVYSSDRMSMTSTRSTVYYGQDGLPYNPYTQAPVRPPPPASRSEIIVVSDDRVMAVQLAARTTLSDSMSVSSMR